MLRDRCGSLEKLAFPSLGKSRWNRSHGGRFLRSEERKHGLVVFQDWCGSLESLRFFLSEKLRWNTSTHSLYNILTYCSSRSNIFEGGGLGFGFQGRLRLRTCSSSTL
jgi:hypothetical protein